MTLQQGDFIELNYTGRVDDSDKLIFDTTEEKVAQEAGIYDKNTSYGPTIVVLGEGHLLKGLDKELIGKEIGKKYTIKIADVDGFGKKDAKKLQLVPEKIFKKEGIRPFAGLQVNVDGQIGIVRSQSGGRIVVDFNHPLSSKDLEYEVDVIRIVEDTKEQVEAFFKLMGFKAEKIEAVDKKVSISIPTALPEELSKPLTEDIKRLTKVDEVEFINTKEDKKE